MEIEVKKLHPLFAAEIRGIDIASEMTPELVEYIEDAMAEYAVVVLPDQGHATDAQHEEFSRCFGPREKPSGAASGDPKKQYRLGGFLFDAGNLDVDGEILAPDHPRRRMRSGDRLWHHDSSFNPMPTKWSMLLGRIVPPEGGNTEFADCRSAYDALDDETKAKIDDLAAEHSIWTSREKGGLESVTEEQFQGLPPVIQRVVHTIPRSGRKAFAVGAHSGHVFGMPDEDGKALMQWLTDFATQPRFVYSHQWRQGDLVIWDNRAVMHRATPFEDVEYKRDMRRTTIDEYKPTWADIG